MVDKLGVMELEQVGLENTAVTAAYLPEQNFDDRKDNSEEAIEESDEESPNLRLGGGKVNAIIDTDSEDEDLSVDETHKKRRIVDRSDNEHCDKENDVVVTKLDKSFTKEPEQVVYILNSKGQLVAETPDETLKSKLNGLCDSESEDESMSDSEEEQENQQPIIYKKKSQKNKEETSIGKKMTAKEAIKQRNEIQSESQRMCRETNVLLPYHKPKSYSLKDFLSKRSKLAISTVKGSPLVAMKMSTEQLSEVEKKLKEREKEIVEFYKSESECDDDENDKDFVPFSCEKKEEENMYKIQLLEGSNEEQEGLVLTSKVKDVQKRLCFDEVTVETQNAGQEKLNSLEDSTSVENVMATKTVELEKEKLDSIEKNLDKVDSEEVILPESGHNNENTFHDGEETEKEPRVSGEYNFNLDDIDESATEKPLTRVDLLKEKLSQIQPKLTGNSEDVIDLETGITKPSEISKLIKRFVDHNSKKVHKKQKVYIELESIEHGEVKKETLSMNVDDQEEASASEEKPGAKLQRLREELQKEMALKRSEIWQQKNTKNICEQANNEDEEVAYEEADFLDDEEEEEQTESEEELEDEEEMEELEEEAVKKSSCVFIDGQAEESEQEEEQSETEYVSPVKPLRRIVKGFDEDSEDEDLAANLNTSYQKVNTSATEDVLPPPHQIERTTPQGPTTEPSNKPDLGFLTPVTYITGLQNLNSKFPKESPVISPFHNTHEPSPLKDNNWHSNLQKKLFKETEEPEQENNLFAAVPTESSVEVPSTQDLLDVCSGNFSSSSQVIACTSASEVEENNSEETTNKTLLNTDHDLIISQLLDEEEMENFKKKFDNKTLQESEEREEVRGTGGRILSDDEDSNDVQTKKRKKLVFSDSEDSDEDQDEPIDLHDEVEDIAYDSEENEVLIEIEKPLNEKLKASDFFEEEAELSESEWGSADEDEQNLDDLEFEEGDNEKYDENKLRTDLERIHMRKVLDDDTREVKLLQELLLDDGELHGTGRQRQFRWKNIDSIMQEEEGSMGEAPEDFLDEPESEEQWRRERHERAIFLQEEKKKNNGGEEESLTESQLLKIGHQVLQRSQSSDKTLSGNSEESQPFSILSKRGSFLSRSEQVLQRLAEITKGTTSTSAGVSTVKNSRHFVFHAAVDHQTTVQDKKRKASDSTPQAIKKLRLTSNLSPLNAKSKAKSDKAKKLFGNW